jgi:hypothetical protein
MMFAGYFPLALKRLVTLHFWSYWSVKTVLYNKSALIFYLTDTVQKREVARASFGGLPISMSLIIDTKP